MQTTGNTILITGGTSGIGLAFAEKLFQLGNRVIICGRREDRLRLIEADYPGIITNRCDISNIADRETLIASILETYPDINVLINNAGVQLRSDLTRCIDVDQLRNEVETNFIAPVHLSCLLAEHFAAKKHAAIINISSGLAFTPKADVAVYCATKAAIHSISLSLRYQLRHTNVKVFELAPPSVDTELGHQQRSNRNETHGGISAEQFVAEAIDAIHKDETEAAVGLAKKLRAEREGMFSMLNR